MAKEQKSYPCEQCGATLTYKPGERVLTCAYCGHTQSFKGLKPNNQITDRYQPEQVSVADYKGALNNLAYESPQTTHLTVKCSSCGAEFDFDANIHADECPFCGQVIVSDAHETRAIQPWGILPFSIPEKSAQAAFSLWIGGLFFAPNKLKRFARADYRLKGLYVPYWSYDCHTASSYVGQRGDAYQVPVRVRVVVNGRHTTQTRMQTRIRWSPARGRVAQQFNDVLVYASNSLPSDMARELAPWDVENIEPYQPEFLSGFQSELYSVNLENGFSVAKYRIDNAVAQSVRYDIGGDFQRIDALNTDYNDIGFRHILLPFWVAGFQYREKTYQFIVNGRTGEVQGGRPYSWIKISLAVLAAIIITFIGLYIYFKYQQGSYTGGGYMIELPGIPLPF